MHLGSFRRPRGRAAVTPTDASRMKKEILEGLSEDDDETLQRATKRVPLLTEEVKASLLEEVLDPLVAALDEARGRKRDLIRLLVHLADGAPDRARSRVLETLDDCPPGELARWKILVLATGRLTTRYDLDWGPVLTQLVPQVRNPKRRTVATGYLKEIGREDPDAVIEALVGALVDAR